MKDINYAPALLLAAQNDRCSISLLVLTFRINGLGGDRACRKLIDDLARLDYVEIRRSAGEDRREKSVHVTAQAHAWLQQLRATLESIAR